MPSFPDAPNDAFSEEPASIRSWIRQAAQVLNRINRGKLNVIYRVAEADFTLAANQASTTITDARLSWPTSERSTIAPTGSGTRTSSG